MEAPKPDVLKIKRMSEYSVLIMLMLGIVTLLLAPATGNYRGFYLAILLGGITLVDSIVYLPIIHTKKSDSPKEVAVPAIQSLWVSTSMGLGYVVTALAPYFKIVTPVAITLFIIGWVMLIFGMWSMIRLSKLSGAPLAV